MIGHEKKRILILYDHHETYVKTIVDYLESFYRYSRHDVSYVSSFAKCHFDLDFFDAVVLHYSVRMCFPGHLSASFTQALQRYQGLKALFIQDEYDHTYAAQKQMLDLGINLVFTCVPEESIAKVYPPERFGHIQFVNVLTGYVPTELSRLKAYPPTSQRSILIGYRGRNLGHWYGELGQEKQSIGMRMKEICDAHGLKTDIAWREEDRIYDGWFDFLGRSKATLGTESGANIFDWGGTLAQQVKAALARNPKLTFEEARAQYFAGREGEVVMNQISPKAFEAIACGTALVLFEGRYSGVLEPGKHFIPLKKDFSNIDDVLARLQDDAYLEAMTHRAYADIIGSGKYSYAEFLERIDAVLERSFKPIEREQRTWLPLPSAEALPTFCVMYQKNFEPHLLRRMWGHMPGSIRGVLNRQRIKSWWNAFPSPVRAICRPILNCVRSLLKPAH